jgi:hypothetical protein
MATFDRADWDAAVRVDQRHCVLARAAVAPIAVSSQPPSSPAAIREPCGSGREMSAEKYSKDPARGMEAEVVERRHPART